ncbi:Serine/threonine-protein kinase Nek7 [Bienertia sinuspersici]
MHVAFEDVSSEAMECGKTLDIVMQLTTKMKLSCRMSGDAICSRPIQPFDVLSSNGRRYFVEFDDLHQPIRKGCHILVKFLGYITKMVNYCPLGAFTWHNVEETLKFDILKKMRKTQKQHYDPVPSGHTSNDWIELVNYCFSPKGQKLSQIGKEARSLQCQTHIMGANSNANLEPTEHGKPMGLIEAWERSHVRKDGSFVEGTVTQDFWLDAKAKVETMKLSTPSTSCTEDLVDEAFHDVLNGGKFPNDLRVLDLGSKGVMFIGFEV